jgi:glycerol-3-phosphate dehydrogenase
MFNHESRKAILGELKTEKKIWDLVVVGGGITGAGVARDAASRGLRVLLVEANDFASGTSSRSSKLVHGGIRYLENLEFGLVHEALTERKILLDIAPHMVHPLRFLIPIYDSSRVGLVKMEMGMILYDLLSMFDAPQLHEAHGATNTHVQEPLILQEGLKGSVVYSDAYMEDDRLVVETLRSATALGAKCINYAKVTEISENENQVTLAIQDTLTGDVVEVHAHQVAGCVGPWTDIFGFEVLKDWKKSLRPTKGVHVIFPREKLPVHQAVVMAVEARIIFVIPRGEIVIVGTTDTDFPQNPGEVNADSADVDYLLAATNKYFPELQLGKKDIISCYSGVRPLVDDGAKTEGKTSREHHIFNHSEHITLVAGGKYTTYRAMAEEIVDAVLAKCPFETRMKWRAPSTKTPLNPLATREKLNRAQLQSGRVAEELGLPVALVLSIVNRHGEEAFTILNSMANISGSLEERHWLAEAKFSITNEMCLSLVDFYWRRSPLFLFHKDNGLSLLRPLALVFQAALGWTDSETNIQMEKVLAQAAKEKSSLESSAP